MTWPGYALSVVTAGNQQLLFLSRPVCLHLKKKHWSEVRKFLPYKIENVKIHILRSINH